jgi:hypothetical protein
MAPCLDAPLVQRRAGPRRAETAMRGAQLRGFVQVEAHLAKVMRAMFWAF